MACERRCLLSSCKSVVYVIVLCVCVAKTTDYSNTLAAAAAAISWQQAKRFFATKKSLDEEKFQKRPYFKLIYKRAYRACATANATIRTCEVPKYL